MSEVFVIYTHLTFSILTLSSAALEPVSCSLPPHTQAYQHLLVGLLACMALSLMRHRPSVAHESGSCVFMGDQYYTRMGRGVCLQRLGFELLNSVPPGYMLVQHSLYDVSTGQVTVLVLIFISRFVTQ